MSDPTPAKDSTPTPASTPSASPGTLPFTTYLTKNVGNHVLLFGAIALIAAIIYGVLTIRDLRQELANQVKQTATLSQKFTQVGTTGAAITGNTTATANQVRGQANDVFGAAVINAMQQQDAKIQSLTSIVGQVASSQTQVPSSDLQKYTQTDQNAQTGKLTGYPIEVSRQNAPALDSVNLFYDPTKQDPTQAFAGTNFLHYNEQFTTSVGDWERQKDGGYRTTVKLTRTVTKPNPLDPTKLITVGTESIPLDTANTVYAPQGLLGGAPLVMPRWTLDLGASRSNSLGYQAFATVDFRITDRLGIFAGTANQAAVAGVSIRLGGNTKN